MKEKTSQKKFGLRNSLVALTALATTAAGVGAVKVVNTAETPTNIEVRYVPTYKTEIDVKLGKTALEMPQPPEMILPEPVEQTEIPGSDADSH